MFGYCALLSVIVLIGCGGAEERKAKYLERGISYYDEKNYEKARVEFKNVLQIDPKSAEPYYYLGLINEINAELRSAYFMYTKALELKPGYIEAEIKLARLHLAADQADEAESLIKSIAEKSPESTDARYLQAMLAYKKNDQDSALELLRGILETNPDHLEASSTLATINFNNGDVEAAEKILTDALTHAGDDLFLLRQLMAVYDAEGKSDRLEELFLKVIALQPDDLRFPAGLAGHYAKTGEIAKGEEILRQAVARNKDNIEAYLLVAKYLVQHASNDVAEKELKDSIERNKESNAARFALAEFYDFVSAPEKADAVLRDIINRLGDEPDGLKARNKIALHRYVSGDFDAAMKEVEKVLGVNPQDNDALATQGRVYLSQGQSESAINSFRALLKDQPNSSELLSLLAEAHKQNNELLLANEALMNAIAADPDNLALRLKWVNSLIESEDFTGAEQELERILQKAPGNIDVLKKIADLRLALGQTESLGDIARKIISEHPEDPTGYFGLAKLYSWEKKYPQALEHFILAYEKKPDDYLVITSVASTFLAMDDVDGGIAWLTKHETADNSQYFRNIKGELLLSQKKYDEAAVLFRQAIDINKNWSVPYVNLANLNLLRGDKAAAEAVMKDAIKTMPNDPQLILGYGNILLQTKKPDEAVELFEGLIDHPRSGDAFFERAVAILLTVIGDDASVAKADNMIAAYAVKHPKNPLPKLLKAKVSIKQGDTDAALARIDEALSLDRIYTPALRLKEDILRSRNDLAGLKALFEKEKEFSRNNPAPLTGLGNIYMQEQNYDAALREFDAAYKLSHNKAEALGPVVYALMGMDRYREAENRVRALIDAQPVSSTAYNLLGEILRNGKEPAKAQDAFRQSVKLSPDWDRPVINLANSLFISGDAKSALQALDAGLARMPGDYEILLAKASISEKTGNIDTAEKIYLELVEKDKSDQNPRLMLAGLYERNDRVDQAIESYEKVIMADKGNVVAKNNLAVLLVDFRANEENLNKAKDLIKFLESSEHPALLDTVGWVLFKTGDTEGALTALTKAVSAAPQLKQLNYHIGMVYHAKGDNENARKYLKTATDVTNEAGYLGLDEARKTLESIQQQ
jgi:tetratricopeptide (TPR) repeat protein